MVFRVVNNSIQVPSLFCFFSCFHQLWYVFKFIILPILAVLSVCKRFKDQVLQLQAPIQGVAPLRTAIRKLQPSSEHLTTLHADFLLLCILSKCYRTAQSILDEDIIEVDQPRIYFSIATMGT